MQGIRSSKRGRVELYGDILRAIQYDLTAHGAARLTRVQGAVNVPYDRFRRFVEALVSLRLVSLVKRGRACEIVLEQKGLDYLRHYEAVRSLL